MATPREAAFDVLQAILQNDKPYAVVLSKSGVPRHFPKDGAKFTRLQANPQDMAERLVGVYDFDASLPQIEEDIAYAQRAN